MIGMPKVTKMITEVFNDKELEKRIEYSLNNRYREFYPNGYGVSIIPDIDNSSFYEVAVLKGTEENFEWCNETPITDDVIKGLTLSQAHEIAKQISELETNFTTGTLN
jgi:hypothetical protein